MDRPGHRILQHIRCGLDYVEDEACLRPFAARLLLSSLPRFYHGMEGCLAYRLRLANGEIVGELCLHALSFTMEE